LFLDQYGGEAVLGRPLNDPHTADDGALEQAFENAVLFAPPQTPSSVRLRPLGAALGPAEPPSEGSSDTVGLYYPQTGHYVLWAFASFYRAHGGEQVLGLPLEEGKAVDGLVRQRFENVVLEYRPDLPPHLAVQLAPLALQYAGPTGSASPIAVSPHPTAVLCDGVAPVNVSAEQAVLPTGAVQHLRIQILRSDGQAWIGVVPVVVVHAPRGDLYPAVGPTDRDGVTIASVTVDGLRPGEIVNYEVVVAAENCTGYAINQFAGGL
jgi:hypothetical protein